ncbi:MAG: hypothetical protein M1828_007404 [Chrysothrix sp. TS-e1954]|nr:MAG: hypothetical protein M1828_007404 [Chrysothrix sp. TS-e1954]
MNSFKPSTLVYASLGTAISGMVAYAVYFDHKRRSDPDFRKALKRESRKQARAAKEEEEEEGKRRRAEIRELVDEANEEGYPKEAQDKEAQFMQTLTEGEQLCNDSSSQREAALCFFRAMKLYPAPQELMTLYDKTVPKHILDILAEMVAYDRRNEAKSSASSSAGVDE